MRRLLNKYRWELWLFIGIPTVVSIIGAIYNWSGVRWAVDSGLRDSGAVTGLAAVVALGVSYPWVRRLGRPMLADVVEILDSPRRSWWARDGL